CEPAWLLRPGRSLTMAREGRLACLNRPPGTAFRRQVSGATSYTWALAPSTTSSQVFTFVLGREGRSERRFCVGRVREDLVLRGMGTRWAGCDCHKAGLGCRATLGGGGTTRGTV